MFYPSLLSAGASVSGTMAESAAQEAKADVELLKHDVDRLLMITEALWILLKQQHGYTDEVLTKLVTEIDLRDGRLDGRSAGVAAKPCPFCQRPISMRRAYCLYCGKPVQTGVFVR